MGVYHILVSRPFFSFMSCLHTTRFYLRGMHYLQTLLFIIIKWKDTLQYSSLHSCDSISFLLSIFPIYSCENYLSSKIYFLCFFLAYFIIALEPLFLHGIRAQACSSSIDLRSYLFSLAEHIRSHIPLRRRACLTYNIFSQFFFAGCSEFLLECIKS